MFKEYFKEDIIFNEGNTFINEFTIGFELEAWSDNWDLRNNFDNWAFDFWDDERKHEVNQTYDKSSSIRMDTINMGYDPTIEPDSPYYSTHINDCYSCSGTGTQNCPDCDGAGHISSSELQEDKTVKVISESCETCDGTGEVPCPVCDGTGKYEYENEEDERTFEWSSPVLNLTPMNIQRIIKFLYEGVNEGFINTNETCGFHIHVGFPDIKMRSLDMFWVLCQLVSRDREEMFEKLLKFKGFLLTNIRYAQKRVFEDMKDRFEYIGIRFEEEIDDGDDEREILLDIFEREFIDFYNSEKHLILRQHPQGTLEWRGARGLMDDRKRDDIKQFLITKLYPFVKWMSDMLDEDKIIFDKYYITRKEFNKAFENRNAPSEHANRRELEKLKGKHSIKFHRNQDMSIISAIYKDFPWLNKCMFEGVRFFYVTNGKLVAEFGAFTKGDFYCDTKNIVVRNDVRILSGFHQYSRFVEHSTFVGGEADVCKFQEGNPKITGGTLKNCSIDDSDIFGGNFEECSIIDTVVHDGTFNKCKWQFYDKGKWINGTWVDGYIKHLDRKLSYRNFEPMHGLNPNEFLSLIKKTKAMPEIGQRDYTRMPEPNESESLNDYINRARSKR